ncbi:hypothetical protein NEOLEDRAFT_810542 [Neolentinus lepideus HHB14362 ss-1]|uniref:Uncharacterized protein n=1 Tax=Neolentinus lepideus HHB14362 ss-1 TaxID=1314782 RepID=A0A165PEB6_9AGAM|nr:hypothetical protein NEOLEDRAFT_810542 [Neolentinus lepideus HHB14362 ss-1]
METVSVSPVTTLMNNVSRRHEKQKEDFTPDPEWIKALQDRINESKKNMRAEALRDFEDKLAEADPMDPGARDRLTADYEASLVRIDRILIQQYKEEVDREKAQRRILAGLPPDDHEDPVIKALIEEQAAILAAIKNTEKPGDQGQKTDESAAGPSRRSVTVDLDALGHSSGHESSHRLRVHVSDRSIRTDGDESGPLPDPSIFAESPRRSDGGQERRNSKRRSSSSSTRKSAVGQEFWRPPPGTEEQSTTSRTYSPQLMDGGGLHRRDSTASGRLQKELEAVDAAEGQWAEINRRNQDKACLTVQENRISGIRTDSRLAANLAATDGLSASPHATTPSPNGAAPSVSSKRIVNKASFVSEDPRNGVQVSPIYGPQPRNLADYSGAPPYRSGSFEDRHSIPRPTNPYAQRCCEQTFVDEDLVQFRQRSTYNVVAYNEFRHVLEFATRFTLWLSCLSFSPE